MRKLFIIEGLPCTGKSTAARFVSEKGEWLNAVVNYHCNGVYAKVRGRKYGTL